MAFDSPSLGGHTFQNPPKPMEVRFAPVQQINNLADGGVRQRILGYKLEASLSWNQGWIRSQDLTGIAAVANDSSATLTFIPRPQSKPTLTYEVIWVNKFDFSFHDGRFNAYGGSIELVSPSITNTVGDLP